MPTSTCWSWQTRTNSFGLKYWNGWDFLKYLIFLLTTLVIPFILVRPESRKHQKCESERTNEERILHRETGGIGKERSWRGGGESYVSHAKTIRKNQGTNPVPSALFLSLFFFLLNPGFPRLTKSRVFPGKNNGRDI